MKNREEESSYGASPPARARARAERIPSASRIISAINVS